MKKNKKAIVAVLVVVLLLAGFLRAGKALLTWNNELAKSKYKYTIVIDPGHGGIDPGKVGVNNVYEKEINLKISLLLREILEQNDCRVILTRESDKGLYQETDSNKKMSDLRKRCELINESGADAVVSVHQNSFFQESSKGAQVFYQSSSMEGKRLAEIMQKQMISSLDQGNRRAAKANDNYYMLKNTQEVMVIVECGFLSNPEEAKKLTESTYQRQVAWAIALGTLQYLEGTTVITAAR